ncbi:hypothetical protein [Selenomonas sp. KH1T6]|uniref:hypothetical protein n=1 Tax=Selenomonas sp. KH1T6 TaxID=3158784 RepID=UPI0008A72CF8|nr:hypothetical protein SAMN05216583_11516 [Selenomonas ruminantium]
MENKDVTLLSVYSDAKIANAAVARADAEEILSGYNFRLMHNYLAGNGQPRRTLRHFLSRTWNGLRMYRSFSRQKPGCMVIQYPFVPKGFSGLFRKALKGQKIIFLIHDVDSLRSSLLHASQVSTAEDIDWLNRAAVLIVHNHKMEEKLREMGVNRPDFVELGVFDYLIEGEPQPKKFQRRVTFAGNLGKSAFLPAWLAADRDYDIDLYGMNWRPEEHPAEKVSYHGSMPARQLPTAFTGGFGLVWDGDSIETESGMMGEYNKYNNPHKFSLYLAAGLPVIVWKQAAVAEIVEKYGIGFCVDSLQEINDLLAGLTEQEYQAMCRRIEPLQHKVVSGGYLSNAMDKSLATVYAL